MFEKPLVRASVYEKVLRRVENFRSENYRQNGSERKKSIFSLSFARIFVALPKQKASHIVPKQFRRGIPRHPRLKGSRKFHAYSIYVDDVRIVYVKIVVQEETIKIIIKRQKKKEFMIILDAPLISCAYRTF